nr:sulfite exporter TauE/SafE family protein [Kineococcus siccus]
MVVSAALQTATGFGFAILSAPVLAAVLGPGPAVSTIVATGVLVDVLVLLAGGRRPQPRVRDVVSLGLWSLPGLIVGAVLLRELPSTALQLMVAAAVLYAVVHRLRPRRPRRPRDGDGAERWWSPAPAGLASGVLSTSTTLGGPPVVLYLTRRPRTPQQTRDTLVALSLFRLPLSVAALLLTGTWFQPASLPLLWSAIVVGYVIGRWAFARMDLVRYERAVLAALVAAALTAIVAAIT